MFVTGLTYQNIIDREPAIADFIPDYATSLQARIDEAKAVIDNRLRAMGYDLDRIGRKTFLFDRDNTASNYLEKLVTPVSANDILLIVMFTEYYINPGESCEVDILNSLGQTVSISTFPVGTPINLSAILLPYIDMDGTTIGLVKENNFLAGAVLAYLTDPAIYFIHLYKSLELIYETMRSAPGDLFEMKSNYYHNLYETEFNSLATYYDRNGDGTMQNEEMQHMKRARILR